VISSLDESIAMLHKYEEEQAPVWFSVSAAGVFFSTKGFVSSVSESKLTLDPAGGWKGILILWDVFDVAKVEYLEPREVPREDLGAFMEDWGGPLEA